MSRVELIDKETLKKELKLNKLPPVYYIKDDLVSEIIRENPPSDLNSDKLEEVLSRRPFDDMVVISKIRMIPDGAKEDEDLYMEAARLGPITSIAYVDSNGRFRTVVGAQGNWVNTTIRDNFDILNIDVSRDIKMYQYNLCLTYYLYAIFAKEKLRIYLDKGATRVPGSKKNKLKKQNYLYVSGVKYESKSSQKSLDKCASILCSSVAGHRREFSNESWNGHNRMGETVKGWTWVRPYDRGEGKEDMDRIRMWVR